MSVRDLGKIVIRHFVREFGEHILMGRAIYFLNDRAQGITLIDDPAGLPLRFEVSPNPTPEQLRLRSAWLGRPTAIP